MDTSVSLGICAFVISYIAEFAYGLTSFGPAIVFEVCWEICSLWGIGSGKIQDAIINIVVMEIVMGLVQSVYLRKGINWSIVVHLSLLLCPMIVVGGMLLTRFDDVWLKRGIGGLLLMIALHQMTAEASEWRERQHRVQKQDDEDEQDTRQVVEADTRQVVGGDAKQIVKADAKQVAHKDAGQQVVPFRGWRVKTALIICGMFAGFMRGLFGIAGPPMMIFLRCFPLDHQQWRSSNAVMRVILNLTQLGYLGVYERKLQTGEWSTYICIVCGGLAGLGTGNSFAHLVDRQLFRRCLLVFLFSGAGLMCVAGLAAEQYVAYGIFAAAAIAALVAITGYTRRRCTVENRVVEGLEQVDGPDNAHLVDVVADGANWEKQADDTPHFSKPLLSRTSLDAK